ncbi:hypothetical protein QE152_g12539 [Popillia japonica]|uniref:Uncharacterized protein n=1 Tax=Popillia japonica TaxID=7064 RepID=A0AAW1LQQ7_POPJA
MGSYRDATNYKLVSAAMPTLLAAKLPSARQALKPIENIPEPSVSQIMEYELEPLPSTSSATVDAEIQSTENISRILSRPTKKLLLKTISRKQDHFRKLNFLSRKRGRTIKDLSRLDIHNNDIMKAIFKDMSSTTRTLMLSQMKCARRPVRGRRWTMDEKVLALLIYKRSLNCYLGR